MMIVLLLLVLRKVSCVGFGTGGGFSFWFYCQV
jgi:hypothetical protein